MERDEVVAILRASMPSLRREFDLAALWLFGSTARGDNRPDSDVDILVEFEPDARPTLLTLAGLRGRLTDLLGRSVDVGTPDSLRPHLRGHVEAERLRVA